MVNMWKFLVFFAAVVVWLDSSQGQREYLTTVDGWNFYKVRAVGAMTNTKIKATCEATGMRYPCHYSGNDGCNRWWASDCITYDDAGVICHTPGVLSANLCGDTDHRYCQPLDDTFVYIPNWQSDDSAYGVDYDTHSMALHGANYNNMYALCADFDWCSQAQCPHGWDCQDYTFYFQCVHPDQITSRMAPYQCSSASCPDGMYCTEEGVASFSCKTV
ncbi:PREDICTED: uncharacterized protein LOC109465083 [Branchiostoma belcheri]|uniref:Uncharacterized protein LOC109465083 n=1 Tax=Branchiostoma belcheri TaxID=7741 RepID=A0A6P4Y5Z7_BRABE|nr:PREDICTED: uncharacterized protein LOC109465083 [Branchiostoma belcheri]